MTVSTALHRAWVSQGQNAITDRVYRRIEDMTGLATKSAEDLHVLNYGVGGHYDVHVDFFDMANVRLLLLLYKGINPSESDFSRRSIMIDTRHSKGLKQSLVNTKSFQRTELQGTVYHGNGDAAHKVYIPHRIPHAWDSM